MGGRVRHRLVELTKRGEIVNALRSGKPPVIGHPGGFAGIGGVAVSEGG